MTILTAVSTAVSVLFAGGMLAGAALFFGTWAYFGVSEAMHHTLF